MPLTDEEVIAQRDDREMLLRPHLWPYQAGRRLYVKRSDGRKGHTGPCRIKNGVYVVTEYNWTENGRPTVRHYATVDELLADGWVVD